MLVALLTVAFSASGQIEEPVKWSTSVVDNGDSTYNIVMSATIDEPFYMYDMGPYVDGPNATTFTFLPAEGLEFLGEVQYAEQPSKKYDENFAMEIGYFKKSAQYFQKVKLSPGVSGAIVNGSMEWQTCRDEVCLPPTDYEFTVKIGEPSTAASTTAAVESAELTTPVESETRSLWGTIIEAILWGFAALLTPCVFPMVPMTVSFFMKSSGNKAKGRFMAAMYGLSIVALYTLPIAIIILITYIAGGDAVTTDIFNWIATHWLPNVLFFLVFMFFAASFFGAFEIVMPSKLVNKSDANSDKGGLIGVFFMALTLVLVSFSCTGPIVGSILVQSTQGGMIWEPIITMLVFSAAFALPFTLFAFFPSMLKNLPKSGGWLNSVKVVLGFIELALGLKFLSTADQTYHWGILDREVYLALWITIFTLLGLYLLGKLKFAHDSDSPFIKVKSLFFAIITFSFVVYLIPGMFGAPLKVLSGYLPPMHTLDFNLATNGGGGASSSAAATNSSVKYGDFLHLPHGLSGFYDYNEGVAYAQKVGKPVMLDFTGHGCVNCREMEAKIWSDPRVLEILRNDYVIIALYTDDKTTLPENEWVTTPSGKVLKSIGKINSYFQTERYNINGQPYYVLLDSNEKPMLEPLGYVKTPEPFIQYLTKGVEIYKATK